MKKTAIAMAIICLVTFLSGTMMIITAGGADAPALSVTSSGQVLGRGDTFSLTVELKKNPGVWAVCFTLPIDDRAFEFVSADPSASILPIGGVEGYDHTTGAFKFNRFGSSFFDNVTKDGLLTVITIRVKDDAPAGVYTLTVTSDDVNTINVSGNSVALLKGETRVQVGTPVETTVPVETTRPAESTVPEETTRPVETTKPVETTRPAETTEPIETETDLPVTPVEPEEEGRIVGASLLLGEDIAVRFYAKGAKSGSVMRFTYLGEVTEAEAKASGADGEVSFTLYGIEPKCLGDGIKAELVENGNVTDVREGYSVLSYCSEVIGADAATFGISEGKYSMLKSLACHLLEYGAASQTFYRYKTDDLVNKNIDKISWDSILLPSHESLSETSDKTAEILGFHMEFDAETYISVGVKAEGDVSDISVRITNTVTGDSSTIPLSSVTCNDGVYAVKSQPISLLSYDSKFSIVLIRNRNGVSTVLQSGSYSMRSYALSSETFSDLSFALLVKSAYHCGVCAFNYGICR